MVGKQSLHNHLQSNGGTGDDQTQSVTYNQSFTTKAKNTFERNGYTFQGWSTSTTSLAGNYKVANTTYTYTTVGDTTLYAIWKANRYKVTLDLNGGSQFTPSLTDSSIYVEYASKNIYASTSASEKIAPKALWNGRTFNGWYSAATAGTQIINKNGALVNNWTTANDDTKLYAQWSVNNYTITYKLYSDSETISEIKNATFTGSNTSTKTYKVTDTVTLYGKSAVSATGYELTGWYVSSYSSDAAAEWINHGSSNKYVPGASVSGVYGNVTLTATWKPITTTITLELVLNGGNGPSVHYAEYDAKVGTITAPADRPSGVTTVAWKTGYTFQGFYTADTNGTKIFNANGTVVSTAVTGWLAAGGIWKMGLQHAHFMHNGV